MLLNDAVHNSAPLYVMTLTTHDPSTTSETFRRGVKSVSQRLRRHFSYFEAGSKVEFTRGTAARSGGFRRMHSHSAVKAPEGEDVRLLEGLVRETWEAVTGARRVEVAQMITPGGALNYMGIHHGKVQQAPPDDWRGAVVRWSRGYLAEPVAVARDRAREQLACEALAFVTGVSLDEATFLRACDRSERDAIEASFREYCELRRAPELSPVEVERLVALDGADWDALYVSKVRD
jgi:hypothetical protein